MNASHFKTITIDSELYDRLRSFCDNAGLKFADFVEEALEAAPLREEEFVKFDETNEKIKTIDQARMRSYRRGFWDGFCASFFACQGRMDMSLAMTPKELQAGNDRWRVVSSDGQLKLFDN